MDELAEAKGIVTARESDIQSRFNSALSTVESQSADLASMHTLLPRPDTVVDTDAIKLVGRLNAEILQAAALFAEACSSVRGRPLQDNDNCAASTRVREMFGAKFVDLVQDVPHGNNPAVLCIVFQVCIVVFADWIGTAWRFQTDLASEFFGEVYRNVWFDGAWFEHSVDQALEYLMYLFRTGIGILAWTIDGMTMPSHPLSGPGQDLPPYQDSQPTSTHDRCSRLWSKNVRNRQSPPWKTQYQHLPKEMHRPDTNKKPSQVTFNRFLIFSPLRAPRDAHLSNP
jgi:hypothetical protein